MGENENEECITRNNQPEAGECVKEGTRHDYKMRSMGDDAIEKPWGAQE